MRVKLQRIATARSGDKGEGSNVGVMARSNVAYAFLKEHLTAERVQAYFAPMQPSRVERFEAANVLGLNFLLYDVLAGGASRSLRIDTQGKTLALALLQMAIERPAEWRKMTRSHPQ